MSASFDRALGLTLRFEGGFQMRRDDSGNWTSGHVGVGLLRGTNMGLSAAAYPQLDLVHMTSADAARIYERDYWEPAHCAELPAAVAIAHFDAAVNLGVVGAAKVLQRALGVAEDGIVGPVTLAAARARPERDLVEALLLQRLRRYTQIAQVSSAKLQELPGWVLRVVQLGEALMQEDEGA